MLNVKFKDGRVLIEGSGIIFLKAKSEFSRFNPDSTKVQIVSKNCFSVDVASYSYVRNNNPSWFTESDNEFSQISNSLNLINAHFSARELVANIVEQGLSKTGVIHWDGLLDEHQGIAANAMAVKGLSGLCLFDEQGTGKTISALAAFDLLRINNVVDVAVIVAPKTLLTNWQDECIKFLPEPNIVSLIEGTKNSKYTKINSKADLYLLTYETLSSELILFNTIANSKRVLLIVDESFFVKNPDSNRSRALKAYRPKCSRALILCGTPAPNSPVDLIHQFDLSDNGLTFGDSSIPDNPIAVHNFVHNKISTKGVYIRRTKSDVLPDLAAKKFHVINVAMQPIQAALYDEARTELSLFLKTLDNRSFKRSLATYFQKRSAMLQICTSPKLIDSLITEVSAKYLALDDFLHNHINILGKKVVLWSVYTRSIDELFERYAQFNPVRIDGKVPDINTRQEMVRKFQSDPSTKLFIGNPAAAGAGITLHSASIAIYLSFSNQAAHYMQSLDRIHRRGQMSDEVDYYFIICDNTIESFELKRLSSKQATQSELLGDIEDSIFSLEDALNEIGEAI